MDLVKSHWNADSTRVSLSVPFAKVDRENRLVSGFATLDNVDTGDDVVMASGSTGAFNRFRGNIREMHEPIAAGRLVDFREDSYFDPETKKFYNGIYVTAYVSKGAQNTWEKVLDGTLSGFSIGGRIIEQETEYVADLGKSVRFIKEYDLIELSLVDNPANQFANVFSIVKNQQGELMMKGMAVETHLVNVFWCPTDELAKNSTNDAEACFKCGAQMQNIGWFEKGEDEVEKTASAVAGFLRQKEGNADTKQSDTGEGGVEMTVKKNDEVVTTDDVVDADETTEAVSSEEEAAVEVDEAATDETEAEAEEVAEVDEASTDPDLEKMFDDLKDSVRESIEKTVESVEAKVTQASEAWDKKASELEGSLSELSKSLEAIKNERGEVAKRLDALEKVSAIKKSGEVETAPEVKVKKGLWGGTFFDA